MVVQSLVWALILLSIVLVGVELWLDKEDPAQKLLEQIDLVMLAIFGAEIVIRIATYRPPALNFYKPSALGLLRSQLTPRLLYAVEPLNLIDILTVLAVVPALRGLRALRLLRLLRSTRLLRYSNPFSGVVRAFEENGLLFAVAFSMVGIAVLVGGISIYLVDGEVNDKINSLGDGLYWALVTLTTVGFGDISPISTLGRIVAGALMIAGMFTLALFGGIVGNTLLSTILTIRQEQFRMSANVNHIVICGYNAGARMLLDELIKELDFNEREVVVFSPGQRPQDIPPEFTWIEGDPTKESELDKVRMAYAAMVIIVGSRTLVPQQADAITLMTAFTIRSYKRRHPTTQQRARPIYIAAEILDAENVEHARTAGADEIIETTRLGFSLIARAVTHPGTAAIMSRVAASGAHSLYVGLTPKPPGDDLAWRYEDLARHIKNEFGVLLIGTRDPNTGKDEINPPNERRVEPTMHLLYLARAITLPDAGEGH